MTADGLVNTWVVTASFKKGRTCDFSASQVFISRQYLDTMVAVANSRVCACGSPNT
jgi:hypothetical protein